MAHSNELWQEGEASTSGDVEEAVGGQEPSISTATSDFAQRETGRALPEPCKMTLQAINVHVSAQTVRNRPHEGGMPPMSKVLVHALEWTKPLIKIEIERKLPGYTPSTSMIL